MGSSFLVSTTFKSSCMMNFKSFIVLSIYMIGISFAVPMPWIQGPDFSGLAAKEIDSDNPVTGDESDPHVFYIYRYPMTCGELCFTGDGCGTCENGPGQRTAAIGGDIVDVAVAAGSFTTLVKIVSDLGLVETLKGIDAVTIFAPSDDAFAKLPAGTLESLTPDQAKAIIARHVVAGATVKAADVTTGDVETFGGETVGLVKTAEGGVQVTYMGQTVNVVTADVGASNG